MMLFLVAIGCKFDSCELHVFFIIAIGSSAQCFSSMDHSSLCMHVAWTSTSDSFDLCQKNCIRKSHEAWKYLIFNFNIFFLSLLIFANEADCFSLNLKIIFCYVLLSNLMKLEVYVFRLKKNHLRKAQSCNHNAC